jgi:hypothetical protein
MAQEPLTKRDIIDRSAGICRDLNEAVAPHVRGLNRAEKPRGVIRHGRRFIRASRPYVRELGDLTPSDGGRRYRRFVNNTDAAVDWLADALDALEARRGRLAQRRAAISGEHAARAKRAAKRYGLRRSCIRYVS